MRTTSILLTAILLASAAGANEQEPQRDFGFQPLEIYEFDNGTSRLIIEDINNDGLDDILFANNHISRLEILVRKAAFEETGHIFAKPRIRVGSVKAGVAIRKGATLVFRTYDLTTPSAPVLNAEVTVESTVQVLKPTSVNPKSWDFDTTTDYSNSYVIWVDSGTNQLDG